MRNNTYINNNDTLIRGVITLTLLKKGGSQ